MKTFYVLLLSFTFFAIGYGQAVVNPDEIGIGVDNPDVELAVKQRASPSFALDDVIDNDAGIRIINAANNALIFMDNGGNLVFGFNDVQRSYIASTNGDYINQSDSRLKEDIQGLPNILDKIVALKPASYQFLNQQGEQREIGFIAQELEEYFPDLITESNGYKGLAYGRLSVLAIKAIQELVDQNQMLIDEVKALKTDLETLKENIR